MSLPPSRISRTLALPVAASALALMLSAGSLTAHAAWGGPASGHTLKAGSAFCTQFNNQFSPPVDASSGDTNGDYGTFAPGEVITLTVAAGTSTGSSVSLVYDSDPTAVLAGPLSGPGTLTYTIPAVSPTGMGYYVHSVTPDTSQIQVSMTCTAKPVTPVPVWGPLGGLLSTLALGGLAAFGLRRKRAA